jgi:hypothetical protein
VLSSTDSLLAGAACLVWVCVRASHIHMVCMYVCVCYVCVCKQRERHNMACEMMMDRQVHTQSSSRGLTSVCVCAMCV